MKHLLAVLLLILIQNAVFAKQIEFWLDVDKLNNRSSAVSIIRGIKAALSEVDYQVNGHRISLVVKDHHGSVLRSLKNYKDYKQSKKALIMFGGVHSPPYIRNRRYINQHHLLSMVVWAAGGPITRAKGEDNWIFRVSVDDNLAGGYLVDYAIGAKKCHKIGLLLENTPWGETNKENMQRALKQHPSIDYEVRRFHWGVKPSAILLMLTQFNEQNIDCVLTVGNGADMLSIAKAMLLLPMHKRMKIISHWGIATSDFHKKFSAVDRRKVNIEFLQTCFSFNEDKNNAHHKKVFNIAKNLFPHITETKDITAPVGFIHAYDATKLVLRAMKNINFKEGDIGDSRQQLKQSLEALNGPVNGLVKTYHKPFSKYHEINNPRGHEALGREDYCMAKYGKSDEIFIIRQ